MFVYSCVYVCVKESMYVQVGVCMCVCERGSEHVYKRVCVYAFV